MGIIVMSVFRPKEGKAAELEREVEVHVPLLRRLGLATDHPSTVLRSPDGVSVEIFEWVDQAAIDAAHEHPEVLEMWKRYEGCSEPATLSQLAGADTLFPEFELVGVF